MEKLIGSADDSLNALRLALSGTVPDGKQMVRNELFNNLYASLPHDPEARVSQLFKGVRSDLRLYPSCRIFEATQVDKAMRPCMPRRQIGHVQQDLCRQEIRKQLLNVRSTVLK